jgi:hypothetical protein
MSGVLVLPDGNPRQGGMDNDERGQCIHGTWPRKYCIRLEDDEDDHGIRWIPVDIVDWFERKADLRARGAKNAGPGSSTNQVDVGVCWLKTSYLYVDIEALEKELGREIPDVRCGEGGSSRGFKLTRPCHASHCATCSRSKAAVSGSTSTSRSPLT